MGLVWGLSDSVYASLQLDSRVLAIDVTMFKLLPQPAQALAGHIIGPHPSGGNKPLPSTTHAV
jgi:hypothetical protein